MPFLRAATNTLRIVLMILAIGMKLADDYRLLHRHRTCKRCRSGRRRLADERGVGFSSATRHQGKRSLTL